MLALLYNGGRIISYTILGGIVGALGSVLSLSISVKAGIQIFAGVFMIIMGLNMSGFSIFRRFNLRLPWSACSIKKKPKTPFLIGVLNGLMPCGPLQTMQLYALGTGSAFNGALSMFLFSLGTVPLMLTFGALSGFISKGYTMIDGLFPVTKDRLISLNDEVIRFGKLLNSLNTIKEFEAEKMPLNFGNVDLKNIIFSVCKDFYPIIDEKNINLIYKINDNDNFII